ncbi:uncharacterized protein [Littorina saxatilis]|uniref:Polysaccharide pyruvyl transferase domain-containing protein n=1 Tax=Littorina saxatilis TaxID=31220 RepID=A0AAN9AWS8_9CAEN
MAAVLLPRYLLPLAVFLLWTLTSFLCHKLAKVAISIYVSDSVTSSPPLFVPAVVTFVQTLCCVSTVDVTSRRDALFYVIALSHFLATLATNISMSLTFASSTLAVKMLEPVSSAVLQRMLTKRSMSAESVCGMMVTVLGAVLYVGNPWQQRGAVFRALAMALLSNLLLGVRNVALKTSHNVTTTTTTTSGNQNTSSRFRPVPVIVSFVVWAVVALLAAFFLETSAAILPRHATYFLSLSLASGAFHVTYSYLSTSVVLRYMSVVSHALANIVKRVLVVLLLYVTGGRSVSLWNWAGLALCTAGLLLYQRRRKLSAEQANPSTSSKSSAITNTSFLRVMLFILVIPYVMCVTPAWVVTMPRQMSTGSLDKYGDVHVRADLRQLLFETNTDPVDRQQESASDNDTANSDIRLETGYFSEVLKTNPQRPNRTKLAKDYALSLVYGLQNWSDGQPLMKDPVEFQPPRKSLAEVREFLSRNLTTVPFDTDGLSPYLKSSRAVVTEAERVHLNLLGDLLAGKKYAVLFGWASFENKGDPAISIGEAVLLEKLDVRLIFYVNVQRCGVNETKHAMALAKRYPPHEVAVLMSGGGNMFGYNAENVCRRRAIESFPEYQLVIFSQSMYMRSSKANVEALVKLYCCKPKLTILLRDRKSLYIARRLFTNGTRLALAPDMAFHNGPIARFAPPYYDVLWLYRGDGEKPLYSSDSQSLFPSWVSYSREEWMSMPSLRGAKTFSTALNVLLHGYDILQRGRVVITERLHGHILCVLLDIPHVLLDNHDLKLSSYHNTWTRGLSNCRLADNAEDAVRMAVGLLKSYHHSLPRRLHGMDIVEH